MVAALLALDSLERRNTLKVSTRSLIFVISSFLMVLMSFNNAAKRMSQESPSQVSGYRQKVR